MSEIRSILKNLRDQRRQHDRELIAVTEAQMGTPTSFTMETMMTGDRGETMAADVRWMFMRRFDHLEEHAIQIEEHLRNRFGIVQSPAQRYWAANQEARADVYAALIGLSDADLDDVPEEPAGEWPLRTTLEHMTRTEDSYRENCLWAAEKFRAGEPFEIMPRPKEREFPGATIDDFIQMLDDSREVSLERLLGLTDEELRAPTYWFGIDCDLRFRLMRFAQHEREHTAQIRKWRVQTGKTFSEAARFMGMTWQRNGRLEGILCGAPDDALDRDPGNGDWPIRQILEHIGSAERYFKRVIDDALGD
ncbi:MAG: DinB family protein [Thermomicrobiales bacterium]